MLFLLEFHCLDLFVVNSLQVPLSNHLVGLEANDEETDEEVENG